MDDFYGEALALVHAEAFEALAAAAADTLLGALGPGVPSQRVLDLGCGAGPLSRRLAEAGYSTWGVDVSSDLLALARTRLPGAAFHHGSVVDTPLPPAVAVAAVGEVFNYATAEAPATLAAVFHRVFAALAPGGLFLFDVAAPGRGQASRAFAEGPGWAVGVQASEDGERLTRRITTFREVGGAWSRSQEVHHLRLWPSASVLAELAACGFDARPLPGYGASAAPPGLVVYFARKPERG